MRHLEKLQTICHESECKALFVRWTIHNWATKGPFNVDAYPDTLASSASFASSTTCSRASSHDSSSAWEKAETISTRDMRQRASMDDIESYLECFSSSYGDPRDHPENEAICVRSKRKSTQRAQSRGRSRGLDRYSAPCSMALSAGHDEGSGRAYLQRAPAQVKRRRSEQQGMKSTLGTISGPGSAIVCPQAPL